MDVELVGVTAPTCSRRMEGRLYDDVKALARQLFFTVAVV